MSQLVQRCLALDVPKPCAVFNQQSLLKAFHIVHHLRVALNNFLMIVPTRFNFSDCRNTLGPH